MFSKFEEAIQKQFKSMVKDSKRLYTVDLDKDQLYNLYLDSFPAGTNEIFRERREHDCSCCKHFIRSMGNVVSIKNGLMESIWDITLNDSTYQVVANALSSFVKSKKVNSVFLTSESECGTHHNLELLDNGETITWNHLYLKIPDIAKHNSSDLNETIGLMNSKTIAFRNALGSISPDSVEIVLELIAQDSLYRGAESKGILKEFLKELKAYDELPSYPIDIDRELFAWERAPYVGDAMCGIRNSAIGTLLVDITSGMDLDTAVTRFEKIMAPENYKRPKPIFTKKMLEDAQRTVEELGYMNSLARRHANIDDLSVNDILFVDRNSKNSLNSNIFDTMKSEVPDMPTAKLSHITEVSIDQFIKEVLPTANSLDALVENRHLGNLMSITAPQDMNSKSMFKWNNPFCWTYAGNLTDSDIRQNVKNAGGNVSGDLRFSIQWNDEEPAPSDLDAHCKMPGYHIYFGDRRDRRTGGWLDCDIQNPKHGMAAVENIAWESRRNMYDGDYEFYVNCYTDRGNNGFKAEIEFDGNIYSFRYPKHMKTGENVKVATVHYWNGAFSITNFLDSNISTKEVWGIHTCKFIPVSLMCYSPNYWNEETGIGNKHYFFILKDCKNPDKINGMFNEYLDESLTKHRKVFEALNSKMSVEPTDNQLSGLGFSSTVRNDLVIRVKGKVDRLVRVKF